MKPIVAVVGILERDDHFFVTERTAHQSYAGLLEFAGGKIEQGERAYQAMVREMNEELGVEVSRAVMIEHISHQRDQQRLELYFYLITAFSGEPFGKEGQRGQWIKRDDLNAELFLSGTRGVIEKLKAGGYDCFLTKSKHSNDNLIWLDMEMTGLDPKCDRILEIATIVTDSDLNILATLPVFAIHQDHKRLTNMNEWCIKTHGSSGLTERVQWSFFDEESAEREILHILKYFVDKGVSPICGNSIAQDKRFLYEYMPKLADYFHYRMIDVSSVKELAKRWNTKVISQAPVKKSTHLALDDVRESIAELSYYRENFFIRI